MEVVEDQVAGVGDDELPPLRDTRGEVRALDEGRAFAAGVRLLVLQHEHGVADGAFGTEELPGADGDGILRGPWVGGVEGGVLQSVLRTQLDDEALPFLGGRGGLQITAGVLAAVLVLDDHAPRQVTVVECISLLEHVALRLGQQAGTDLLHLFGALARDVGLEALGDV